MTQVPAGRFGTPAEIAHALRRLDAERVLFLGAARPGAEGFRLEQLERVEIGPLDLSTLDRIIRRGIECQTPGVMMKELQEDEANDASGSDRTYSRRQGALQCQRVKR